jgi:formylglycine-generating enzyme required for sulfatase activity
MRSLRFIPVLSLALPLAAIALSAERPGERVSPAPQVNGEAVIWRTAEPPGDAQAGDVWVNPKDGMELVYIAPGKCMLGGNESGLEVRLKGFWMARTEVTNAQYLRFIEATEHRAPAHWKGGKIPAGLEKFPVVCVSWDDAHQYAGWAGGRLPGELEWERAARGCDGRLYPWGNWWDRKRCRSFDLIGSRVYKSWDKWRPDERQSKLLNWVLSNDKVREGPVAVGSYPDGASPYGCLDMAGNVWEWSGDWEEADALERYAKGDLTPPARGTNRVLRGGSWGNAFPDALSCGSRMAARPTVKNDYGFGFRYAWGAR